VNRRRGSPRGKKKKKKARKSSSDGKKGFSSKRRFRQKTVHKARTVMQWGGAKKGRGGPELQNGGQEFIKRTEVARNKKKGALELERGRSHICRKKGGKKR